MGVGCASVFGVDLPEQRMLFDFFVEQGLGDGGIVDFTVAVTTVADEIDDDVGAELVAESVAMRATRTTASTSSALTWKIGMDWRRAMQAAKRVECSSV